MNESTSEQKTVTKLEAEAHTVEATREQVPVHQVEAAHDNVEAHRPYAKAFCPLLFTGQPRHTEVGRSMLTNASKMINDVWRIFLVDSRGRFSSQAGFGLAIPK